MTHLVFLQHGDFATAYRRFAAGEPETYRDQKRSVDYVAGLTDRFDITLCCFGEGYGETALTPRLRMLALPPHGADDAEVARRVMALAPDIFVCRTPHRASLAAAKQRRIPTFPVFADIFATGGLRNRLRNWRMTRVLQGPHIACVGNHSLNASRSLQDALHLPPDRIVPWDWARIPTAPKAKSAPSEGLSVFFAGMLRDDKGVGDCLDALAILRRAGLNARMSFAGGGDLDHWRAEAARRDLGEAARFLGLIPYAEVARQMQTHDAVVVPSHHSYAEGLPNTIYEALAARSPLILSDHPAFAGRLVQDRECLVFPAGDAAALAGQMRRLCDDPALYAALSTHGPQGLDRLYFGTDWIDLMAHYLADPMNRTGWVAGVALAALDQPTTP